jgi:hypothetical protein
MKRKPKPTPKRLYHATDGTGAVTAIEAVDMDDALEQAFRLPRAARLKAIGNGQVPLGAATAWNILYESLNP